MQSFIVKGVDSQPGQAYPTPVIAAMYADTFGVENTPHLHASVRRAIRSLEAAGDVQAEEVMLPTRVMADMSMSSRRWSLCVSSLGLEWEAFAKSAHEWMQGLLQHDLREAVQNITSGVV
jgi:hypothetical protein